MPCSRVRFIRIIIITPGGARRPRSKCVRETNSGRVARTMANKNGFIIIFEWSAAKLRSGVLRERGMRTSCVLCVCPCLPPDGISKRRASPLPLALHNDTRDSVYNSSARVRDPRFVVILFGFFSSSFFFTPHVFVYTYCSIWARGLDDRRRPYLKLKRSKCYNRILFRYYYAIPGENVLLEHAQPPCRLCKRKFFVTGGVVVYPPRWKTVCTRFRSTNDPTARNGFTSSGRIADFVCKKKKKVKFIVARSVANTIVFDFRFSNEHCSVDQVFVSENIQNAPKREV